MTLTTNLDDAGADTPHPALVPWLEFLRLCIEDPVSAARRVALRLSVAACVIMVAALLAGVPAGVVVGLVYVGSSWTVLLLVRAFAGGRHA